MLTTLVDWVQMVNIRWRWGWNWYQLSWHPIGQWNNTLVWVWWMMLYVTRNKACLVLLLLFFQQVVCCTAVTAQVGRPRYLVDLQSGFLFWHVTWAQSVRQTWCCKWCHDNRFESSPGISITWNQLKTRQDAPGSPKGILHLQPRPRPVGQGWRPPDGWADCGRWTSAHSQMNLEYQYVLTHNTHSEILDWNKTLLFKALKGIITTWAVIPGCMS